MEADELALKQELKKLKQQELEKRRRKRNAERTKEKPEPKPNAIYLSNLCVNKTTEKQLIEEFSKFGMIKRDQLSNLKCKLYRDGDGKPKGDALIVYVRHESVPLAIDMMNGYILNGSQIKVEVAKFENRKRGLEEEEDNRNFKLAKNQDSERDENERSKCTVKINNVLDLYHNLNETELIDIKQDIFDGCNETGRVRRVDLHPEIGEAEIEFEGQEDALACCKAMNGRYFDGRKLSVYRIAEKEATPSSEESAQESSQEDDLIEV